MDASKIGLKHQVYSSHLQKQPQPARGGNFAALIADAMATSEDAAKIAKSTGAGTGTTMDSANGQVAIDIDRYFEIPKEPIDFDGPNAPPLLMPTQNNINALAAHASAKLKALMAVNGIPSAPAEITYDNMGKMQLPQDYAYADRFMKLMAENPEMERELSTVNALTSGYTEMQKSLPFVLEYQAARNGAEANAVVAKYSYLFSNQPSYSQIALTFAADGSLIPTADGRVYNAA